jgi:hypothetical protein
MTEEVLLETPPEEVIVISEPPAPEPEPWQPTTVDHTLGASQ